MADVGIPAATRDGRIFFLDLLLAPCVADLPETEALLGLKQGSQTFTPCHKCFANRQEVPLGSSAKHQTSRHSKDTLKGMNKSGSISAAEDCIRRLSLHPVLPVLNSFPFVNVHLCVELYTLF